MDRSRKALFSTPDRLSLDELIVPGDLPPGEVKCRLVYGRHIEHVDFLPYARKTIHSLVLMEAGSLEYPFKYLDRSGIEQFQRSRREYDEVLFVKNGAITDSSYCNLAFLSGETWYTPSEPLLHGTCRERLIHARLIQPCRITPDDLPDFSHVSLINAMLDLTDLVIPVDSIISGDTF